MKVKPIFFYSKGILTGAEGDALPVRPAQMQIEDFSDGFAEADMAALAKEGANLILLRVGIALIAPAPDSFNEAALARLREIIKVAEERRTGVVLSIEAKKAGAEDQSVAGRLFLSAAEHAARRLKDCAALIGFAAPQWTDEEFLLELATRLEKKRPAQLIFIPPGLEGGEDFRRAPFVPPDFWPQGWL